MKIISLPKHKSLQITCACKAVLQLEFSDVKRTVHDRDGYAGICNCPNCSKEIWIDMSLFDE